MSRISFKWPWSAEGTGFYLGGMAFLGILVVSDGHQVAAAYSTLGGQKDLAVWLTLSLVAALALVAVTIWLLFRWAARSFRKTGKPAVFAPLAGAALIGLSFVTWMASIIFSHELRGVRLFYSPDAIDTPWEVSVLAISTLVFAAIFVLMLAILVTVPWWWDR